MSLLIYRYRDKDEEIDLAEQEAKHLERLKKRIAERKTAYSVKKTLNEITLKPQKPAEEPKSEPILNQEESVEKKQEPLVDKTDNNIQKQSSKKAKPSHEFKVLGVNDFEKKTKVFL